MHKFGKRMLCLIWALCLVVSLIPGRALAAAPAPDISAVAEIEAVGLLNNDGQTDYRKWAQGDSRWGSILLGDSNRTVSASGCTVTSVAKTIIQAGLKNPDEFDVGTLVELLNVNDGFHGANLIWEKPAELVEELCYAGTLLGSEIPTAYHSSEEYNDQLLSWIREGYHLFIAVKSQGHWVAVDEAKSLETGRIHIMDSLKSSANADIALADRYPQFNRVEAYKGGITPALGMEGLVAETYPSYAVVTTPVEAKLWSAPTDNTDHAAVLSHTSEGEQLTATALYRSTGGQYWYKVSQNGRTCYLYAGNIGDAVPLYDDLDLTGVAAPSVLNQGTGFNIGGTLTSQYTVMKTVIGAVNSGEKNVLYSTGACGGRFYDLKGSQVDTSLKFGRLSVGTYTYEIRVVSENCLSFDGETLSRREETVTLISQEFRVVNKSGHTCNKAEFMGIDEEHPHYSRYRCSSCGKVSADTSTPNPTVECDLCRPGVPVIQLDFLDSRTPIFTWEETDNTTHYNAYVQREGEEGIWYTVDRISDALSGFRLYLPVGEYRIGLDACNSELIDPETGEIVVTSAEEVYFTVIDYATEELIYDGIDVSSHQGVIDWQSAAPSVDLVIIRCGYGGDMESQDDSQWLNNIEACTRLNIPIGVYLYSYAKNEAMAQSEVDHVLRMIGDYDLDLPVYLDLEDDTIYYKCSKRQILRNTTKFNNAIAEAGYAPGVYANHSWWNDVLIYEEYDQWNKWVARYAKTPNYDKPHQMWQYSDKGVLPGIVEKVDMNYWYGELMGRRDAEADASSVSFPAVITQGHTPEVSGSVTSNRKISWILGQVEHMETGELEVWGEINPREKEANVSDLMDKIDFAALEPGKYTLRLECISGGEYLEIYETVFNVVSPRDVTVTFDGNGGDALELSMICPEGADAVLPAAVPQRIGYDFLGWDTDSDALIESFWPGDVMTVLDDMTLYAVWAEAEELTEIPDELLLEGVARFPGDQKSYSFTPVETRFYQFAHVTLMDDSGVLDSGDDFRAELEEGHTYFLRYDLDGEESPRIRLVHTVTYQVEEGFEAPEPALVAHGDACILDDTVYTKDRYINCGWSDGTVIHLPGTEFRVEEDLILELVWRRDVNNPFVDVQEEDFFFEPVIWAVEKGVTNGTSPTTFSPSDHCMRAQVVTFLWRAMGAPEPEGLENPFEDVKETDYYYKAVLWALENGITAGMDETHFGPMEFCNRAQVVTFLYRTMGQPEVTAGENPFIDVESGSFYELSVLWAVGQGITNGLSETTFGPNEICNRAQIVTFLYRTFCVI